MLYRALVTIMNNEKKIQEVKKEAGGDEKLIFKFAWPYELDNMSINKVHA